MPSSNSRDPLHGVTLESIVTQLVQRFGWQEMSARIPIRCFLFNPSVKSSLTFLRKTPWARKKVEMWFVEAIADRSSWEDSGEPGKAPSSSSDTGEPATKREPRVVLRKKPNP